MKDFIVHAIITWHRKETREGDRSIMTKKMNVWQLTMLTAANMLGAGIIMLPTKLAQVGTVSIFSWLVTAVGSLCLAHVFAECGMFSENRGGMGGYAAYRFGLPGYYIANFSYSISLIIANVAIAVSAVGYAATLMNWQLSPVQIACGTIGLLWITGILNFGGSGMTGRISSVTVWGAILPVAFVGVLGWFWFDFDLYKSAWNPNGLPLFEAVSESITLTLWTFLGFESAAANMDAIENPQRDVPRATFFGTLFVAIIYILSTNIMAGIVPNADLLSSNAPFGLTFSWMFNLTIGKIIMGMMVISCCGALLCWQFTLSQVFKTGGQTGIFPTLFAKVTNQGVPVSGMIVLMSLQSLMALSTMDEQLFKQFEKLVDLAVVTNVVPYVLCCLALYTIIAKAELKGLRKWSVQIVSMVALLYSLYAIWAAGITSIVGGGIVLLIGFIIYWKTIAKHPEKVDYSLYN